MSDLQAQIEIIIAREQIKRANTQLTLGGLIKSLEQMPPDARVANLCSPDSYRGYYSDLYFEHHEGTRLASELLADCKAAMGQVFIGYKGGEFLMDEMTPLWVAERGVTGSKLMNVYTNGELETKADD